MSGSSEVMKQLADDATNAVCGDRNLDYGDPVDNHERTAEVWVWYLKNRCIRAKEDGGLQIALDGRDVAALNILQKLSRDCHSRTRDSLVDIVGYAMNAEAVTAAKATEGVT